MLDPDPSGPFSGKTTSSVRDVNLELRLPHYLILSHIAKLLL